MRVAIPVSVYDSLSNSGGSAVGTSPSLDASILVVDDVAENLIALEAVLDGLGVNVVRAHSGFDALRCLLHNDFALILLDVQMAGMDGFETAAMIRQRRRSAETPIIFLTAVGKHEAQVFRGYSAGAVDYIFKPFDPEMLRSKVRVFVNLFRKSQKIAAQARELRSAKLKQDAILRGTPLGICTLSQDWQVTWHNLAFSGLFERDPNNSKNFLGFDLPTCFPTRQAFREFEKRVARTISHLGIAAEEQYLTLEGNGFWADISVVQFDPVDASAGLLATISDVTERHNALAALRQSEERYALAARGSADGLWDWDLSTNKIYYSERWHDILGYQEHELTDEPREWFDRVIDADSDRVLSQIRAHLDNGTSHFESEFQMRRKDDSIAWVLSRGMAIRNEKGVAYRMAGSLRDITTRKQAEQELVERERLASIGMTVSHIAHCTKNMLAAMTGAIDLLGSNLSDTSKEPVRIGMQILKSSSSRLSGLVVNMLDYTKERRVVLEPVNINEVFREVEEGMRVAAYKKQIEVVAEVKSGAEAVCCDSQRLVRALINLAINSIDAMPAGGGTVSLKAFVQRAEDNKDESTVVPLPASLFEQEALVIEVSDTGPGIPSEIRSHIFEPFFSTKASRGTGLGLATVKQFVVDHNAGLFLDSSPESGTRFQLLFSPLLNPAAGECDQTPLLPNRHVSQ